MEYTMGGATITLLLPHVSVSMAAAIFSVANYNMVAYLLVMLAAMVMRMLASISLMLLCHAVILNATGLRLRNAKADMQTGGL